MFAQKEMKTDDVRIDVKLNKHIWSKGIRNVRSFAPFPHLWPERDDANWPQTGLPSWCASGCASQVPNRIRVKISRKANEDEDAKVCAWPSPWTPAVVSDRTGLRRLVA
jgi:ribosomal protein L31E